MQTLDVISVNLWQIIVSLLNLIILFLLVKKLFYKPVKKMLNSRQEAIENEYKEAEKARADAVADKQAYAAKMADAKGEADRVVKNAVSIAAEREKEIIAEAKQKADGIVRQAETDAALERKKAEDGIKKEIVEVSSLLAEKMLERELSDADHKRFIDDFIEGIGEQNDAD